MFRSLSRQLVPLFKPITPKKIIFAGAIVTTGVVLTTHKWSTLSYPSKKQQEAPVKNPSLQILHVKSFSDEADFIKTADVTPQHSYTYETGSMADPDINPFVAVSLMKTSLNYNNNLLNDFGELHQGMFDDLLDILNQAKGSLAEAEKIFERTDNKNSTIHNLPEEDKQKLSHLLESAIQHSERAAQFLNDSYSKLMGVAMFVAPLINEDQIDTLCDDLNKLESKKFSEAVTILQRATEQIEHFAPSTEKAKEYQKRLATTTELFVKALEGRRSV